jgi:putative ABC transport system permease protein
MKFLFSMAWRNVWRQGRRTLFTAVAMAVALAFCCAMFTLINGVSAQMFGMMVEQQLGHVQIYHQDYRAKQLLHDTIPGGDKVLGAIQDMDQTYIASGRIKGFGLAGSGVKSSGAQIIGVYPATEQKLTPIVRQLEAGTYLDDAPSHQALLGVDLAKKLKVDVGGELILIGQGADGSVANDLYTVKGIVRTGNVAIDKAGVYLHAAELQEFLVLEGELHEILALTKGKEDIEPYVSAVESTLQGAGLMKNSDEEVFSVAPWWVTDKQISEMLAMQSSAIDIMTYMILFVASFGILNTMMMSVFERTRELGVLRALGISRGRMVLMVMMESSVLAALACALGLFLGFGMGSYLVAYGLDFSTGTGEGFSMMGVIFDPIFYGEMKVLDFIKPTIAVFIISGLASLWPALRAAYLRPVEALRQD